MSAEEFALTWMEPSVVGDERKSASAERREAPADLSSLTRLMARGDESAYREFFGIYFGRLLRYLIVLTGGREEAAREALQLTLLRVVRNVRVFDSDEAFWSWLTVLARSSVVDEARKRKRHVAFLERFFRHEQIQSEPAALDADAQLRGALESELKALAADERVLVERKYFARDSVRQIADALDTTEKAVESRLVRVRRRLKASILARLNHEKSI